jgi:outer membrane lipoprotein-sorting protein
MKKLQILSYHKERRDSQRFAEKFWNWRTHTTSLLSVPLRTFALSAVICTSRFSTGAADSNSALSTWLDAQKDIHSWSADCVQTRKFKTLTQPLVESGKVWFAQPNRFRWELGHPPKTIAARATNEMLLLYPRLKQAERFPLDSTAPGQWRDALALLEAGFPRSTAEMESKFRIVQQTVTNDVCDLLLEPKSPGARKMIPKIQIVFDLKNRSLLANELRFADGSSLRNDFTNAVLNPKLDDSMFSPPIPPDFKVVTPLKQ